jgi:hypothetical protein
MWVIKHISWFVFTLLSLLLFFLSPKLSLLLNQGLFVARFFVYYFKQIGKFSIYTRANNGLIEAKGQTLGHGKNVFVINSKI